KSKSLITVFSTVALFSFAIVVCFLGRPAYAAREDKKTSPSELMAQKQFDTPQEAADALVAAAEVFDVAALKKILVPERDDLVSLDDPGQDKNRASAFATEAREKTT